MNSNISFWHNGFGFMFLWIGGLYVQIGTCKIIVTRKIKIIPLPKSPRLKNYGEEQMSAEDFMSDHFHEERGDC